MFTGRFPLNHSLRFNRTIAAVLVLIIIILGGWMVRHCTAYAATIWMDVFAPDDFPTFHSLITYLAHLRVPIPPFISSCEILDFQITGNTAWVTSYIYRAALVVSFVIAILLAYPSIPKMIASYVVSLLMLAGISVLHTAFTYDILYPFFLLLFFLSLKITDRYSASQSGWSSAAAFLAGFSLSMTELSRPFFFIMLPVALIYSYLTLQRLSRKKFVLFLVPVILLTGAWHIHQYASFRQILWDNHSGFNLQRAWFDAPKPELIPEPGSTPLALGREANFNTAEHAHNSSMLKKAVLKYMISHPMAAMKTALQKILNFVTAPTSIYYFVPEHPILDYYRLAVQLATAFLVAQFIRFLLEILSLNSPWRTLLGHGDVILLCLTVGSILFLSIGDRGEEARFLFSILPLIAAFPEIGKTTNDIHGSLKMVSYLMVIGGLLIGILVLSTLFTSFMPEQFILHRVWFLMLSFMCVLAGRQVVQYLWTHKWNLAQQ